MLSSKHFEAAHRPSSGLAFGSWDTGDNAFRQVIDLMLLLFRSGHKVLVTGVVDAAPNCPTCQLSAALKVTNKTQWLEGTDLPDKRILHWQPAHLDETTMQQTGISGAPQARLERCRNLAGSPSWKICRGKNLDMTSAVSS